MATVADLTDVEYAAIGRIAVESAYLEDFVEQLVITLSRVRPPLGDILLERAMFDSKLTLLSKIADNLLKSRPAKLAELKKIIAKIRANNEERTIAIHGRWVNMTLSDLMVGGGQRNPRAIKRKSQTKKELTVSEAGALSLKIEEAGTELWFFAKKTWPQLLALRVRKRPRRL